MKASDIPAKVSEPFATGAGGAFVRNVPLTTVTPGAASFDAGFPPLTALPTASGGIPPNIQDFNGLFRQITAWNRWAAAGGNTPPWDSAFSALIGGYPKGSLVASLTFGRFWLCATDDNVTNPDASGAGWIDPFAHSTFTRLLSGSGNYTPPANTTRIRVRMAAGGASGGAVNSTGPGVVNGNNGGQSSFGSTTAIGGQNGTGGSNSPTIGVGAPGGTGGVTGTGTEIQRISGGPGGDGNELLSPGVFAPGGQGGGTPWSSGGTTGPAGINNPPSPNSGAGSAGGSIQTNGVGTGGGGGGGEFVEFVVNNPVGPYAYVVGAGGAGVTSTGSSSASAAAGAIYIEEFYY